MKKSLLFIFLIVSHLSFSQQDCLCSQNFDFAYQKVKDNYAGWSDKITPQNQVAFDKLTQEIRESSKKITNDRECYFHLKKWFDFFNDGHLFLSPLSPYAVDDSPQVVASRATKVPQLSYNETSFTQYLKENEAKLQSVEGIWESDDKAYKIGILKDKTNPKKFIGFLLADRNEAWKAGKAKFEMLQVAPEKYVTNYYYADFSSEKSFTREVKNFLVMENIYKFNKIFPIPKEEVSNDDLMHRIADYRIEKLDNETALVVLPPFTIPNATEFVQEMLKENEDILKNTPNLIIDLRNNPGGDDAAFTSLFPYIATGTITRKGGVFKATDENIISLKHELEAIQEYPVYKERLSPKLQQVLQKMETNKGRFVNGPDKEFAVGVTMPNPKKIAFLVNKNTASTAEQFILEAKQSTKTIVFGENTKGLADYIEVRDWGLPCYGWRVAFALAKSPRLPQNPIDNVGISPNVKIGENEADWVEFVKNYLKK
jgi:Peptidase family S41